MTRHQHSCGRVHDCDAAVSSRPAAPNASDDRIAVGHDQSGRPYAVRLPAPDAAAGDGLREECPFCKIVDGEAPAEVVGRWGDALAIVPLNPVTPGHALVLPTAHVSDATANVNVTAMTMRYAAKYARERGYDCNIITSVGAAATQTIRHLHVHVVPRTEGDGLTLPWTVALPALRDVLAAAARDAEFRVRVERVVQTVEAGREAQAIESIRRVLNYETDVTT